MFYISKFPLLFQYCLFIQISSCEQISAACSIHYFLKKNVSLSVSYRSSCFFSSAGYPSAKMPNALWSSGSFKIASTACIRSLTGAMPSHTPPSPIHQSQATYFHGDTHINLRIFRYFTIFPVCRDNCLRCICKAVLHMDLSLKLLQKHLIVRDIKLPRCWLPRRAAIAARRIYSKSFFSIFYPEIYGY